MKFFFKLLLIMHIAVNLNGILLLKDVVLALVLVL